MFKIVFPFLRGYSALSFFIFIFVKDKARLNDLRLINHEKIHFLQQLELLFVFHWILYLGFYLAKRAIGKSHDEAYRENPFEREAYDNDDNMTYLIERKPYAWIRSL